MPTLKKILIGMIVLILFIYLFMVFLVKYITPKQHIVEKDLKPTSIEAKK